MHAKYSHVPTADKMWEQELIKLLEFSQAEGQKTLSDLENEQASRRRLQDEVKQLENLTVCPHHIYPCGYPNFTNSYSAYAECSTFLSGAD